MEEEEKKIDEQTEEKKEEVKETDPKESDSKETNLTDKMRENPWVIATFVLGIVALILLVGDFGGMTGGAIGVAPLNDVEVKVLDFVNSQVDEEVELVSSNDLENGLYEVVVLFQGREIPLYATADGKNLVQGVTPFEQIMQTQDATQTTPTEVPKSDKPVVELFVMSMCPYGTQAEKGILEVLGLLKDKIDFKLRFVSYAMHGKPEMDENTVQYCVQKEQPEKLYEYLICYLDKDGTENWNACLDTVGISKAKIMSCVRSTDSEFRITEGYNDKSTWNNGQFPQYNVDKELNVQYGVQGSPSLIINGVKSNAGRSAASYLAGICAAFNNPPEECNEVVTTDTPAPGFGWDATAAANTAAQCA